MTHKRVNLRWWLATLAGVLMLCVTTSLGLWQLDRAAQKEQLHAAMQSRAASPALSASDIAPALRTEGGLAALLHKPIALQGQWLPAHTVYLDNRQMNGQPGFWVMTPLLLPSGDAVLVQRGWIARNFQDRLALQPIQTPQGTVSIQGHVQGEPPRLFEFDAPQAAAPAVASAHTHIHQNLRLDRLAQASGLALWPITVVQSGPPSEGLLREWAAPNSGVATHYGYAFQWLALAAVLLGLLLWFQVWRPLRQARRRPNSSNASTDHVLSPP